jgi:cholestenol delta-isomerase
MEAITAFVVGPLCLLAAYGTAMRQSWRYTLQILLSLAQLYGDVLYFGTTYFEGGNPNCGLLCAPAN